MSDTEKAWTPTSEVVKDAACFGFPRRRLGEPRGIDRDSFDRWLAARDAEQREAGRLAALEEAERAKAEAQATALEGVANDLDDPYAIWWSRIDGPLVQVNEETGSKVTLYQWLRDRASALRSSSPEGSTEQPKCATCGKPSTYRLGMPEPSWCDEHGPQPSPEGNN